MRIAWVVVAVTVLLSSPAAASPRAAPAGLDAQWCGQSAYLTLARGATGQQSVCFMNTGTVSWVLGSATEVGLAVCVDTPAPQFFACNTLSPNADWASNWTTPRLYAVQPAQIVAPGQQAFFSFAVTAPTTAVPGLPNDAYFRGELVHRATGTPIHPVGYYQLIHLM